MTTYVLWYFKPQYGSYAAFDTNMPTSKLRDLGFDYMIVLHAPGRDGEYGQMPMSGYSYDNGYNGGKQLAQWLEQEVNPELPYLVEIPVLVRDDKEQWELFKNSNYTIKPRIRGLDYWRGWLDGVYTHTSGLQRGFYWNLEFPWQIVRAVVYEEDIIALSEKIKDWGQQFIWIPYVNDRIDLDRTDIKLLSQHFTHVFVQPHYYQTWRDYYSGSLQKPPGEYPYLNTDEKERLDELTKVFRWIEDIPNGSIEMEVDEAINLYPDLVNKPCDYVKVQKRIKGHVWPNRAYYYGTNLRNVNLVREKCPDW